MFIKYGLLALALSLTVSVVEAVDFPPPPKATVTSVAPSTTSMGMRLQIRRFEIKRPMESVLAFYRNHWEGEAKVTKFNGWTMIGSLQGDEYHNVQMKALASGGVWGYLSISDLPKRMEKEKKYSVSTGKRFPMMNGTLVLDDQVSTDIGKDGRVLLMRNRFSPNSNRIFYKNHFLNKGWNVVMDVPAAPRDGAYTLYVSKGRESVAITINKVEGETSIVANHVRRGLIR